MSLGKIVKESTSPSQLHFPKTNRIINSQTSIPIVQNIDSQVNFQAFVRVILPLLFQLVMSSL